jgi:hypothetical protein
MKKLLALVLSIVMIMTIVPLGALTASAETVYYVDDFQFTINNLQLTIKTTNTNLVDL